MADLSGWAWPLLILWMSAEARCFVTARLAYWQRRYINTLKSVRPKEEK